MSEALVEHTFRHEFGRIVARLSAKYGTTNLVEIEDAVSDALLSALKSWAFNNQPQNPAAWLYRVADRKLIDKLRRKQKYYNDVVPKFKDNQDNSDIPESELDLIRLMLWCAHPNISYKDQIAIMLKLVSGFSNAEIGAALLLKEETVKKRIQRAKKKIKNVESKVSLPLLNEVPERFSSIRKALYLTFNEGYFSISNTSTVREDLIYEAMRLCKILCEVDHQNHQTTYALMSLMTFHTSRLKSRLTEEDSIVLLSDQDRSLWDKGLIRIANAFLSKAMKDKKMSEYHLEACIAAVHANTAKYEDTEWLYISDLYKALSEAIPNPITQLNYAFALLKAQKLDDSFAILDRINEDELNQQAYLYHSTFSSYYNEVEKYQESRNHLWKAIDCCDQDNIRKILRERLEAIANFL